MQSLYPLPWNNEHHRFDMFCAGSLFDMPGMTNSKRKRSESAERQVKKSRPSVDLAPHIVPRISDKVSEKLPQERISETPALKASTPPVHDPEPEFELASEQKQQQSLSTQRSEIWTSNLTLAQQVIENELNVQILMKHNELRLIEQELAKCQVSLEQLRRCELRPYPGATGLSMEVTEGVGAAIAPQQGLSRPSHPAPYGVLDGPYSRHYRQWLLPDPQFDSMLPQSFVGASGREATRSSRTLSHAPRKSTSKAHSGMHQRVDSFNSIPNYSSSSGKDRNSPLVLRRSTDGKLVKLICKNCHRGNFSSIQGFLNHCRIAHKVDYKSHDQAAVDCGQLLDQTEVANLPLETQATPMPKSSSTRHSLSAATVKASNFVHHYNTTAGMPVSAPRQADKTPAIAVATSRSEKSNSFSAEPFKASSEVPRLSAHFAKHSVGGNLEQATAQAKQKVELSIEDDLQSPGISDAGSPVTSFTGTRMPSGTSHAQGMHSGGLPSGNSGWKGQQMLKERSRPLPLAPIVSAPPRELQNDYLSSPHDISSASLSPHTVDGNPGLVSDHEDDDHGSASEDEDETPQAIPQSLRQSAGHCSDNMEIDVEEGDEIDEHGVIIRRNSMLAAQARTILPSGSSARKMGGLQGGN